MLPDGFHWQEWSGSHSLYMDGRVVAKYSSAPGAPYVLAYLHCDTIRMGARTYPSEAYVRAYIEGWARKWHIQLREEYAGVARHA